MENMLLAANTAEANILILRFLKVTSKTEKVVMIVAANINIRSK